MKQKKEIEVSVTMTITKSFYIDIDDYDISEYGKDEDGDYYEVIDTSDSDLKGAFLNQHKNLFDGWHIDELEVIHEQ